MGDFWRSDLFLSSADEYEESIFCISFFLGIVECIEFGKLAEFMRIG